jgi:glycosyltransferase involved in cell wall biosynthesis
VGWRRENAALMSHTVAIDARDAFAHELRGWGRYVRSLVAALQNGACGDLEMLVLDGAARGPEVVFEQVVLPWRAARAGAGVVHAPNCFLPLVRRCPGVVTIHDLAFETWPQDFASRTRVKYRVLARAAARSAQRVIVPSQFTASDVCGRYGVVPERVRVIPEAPALALGSAAAPPGRYLLAVGDLRLKKNLRALVSAFAHVHAAGEAGDCRLVLAGVDAGEGPALRALAGEAPVELTGYVSDERLDALIRGAELLVHPSLYEGFGLVVLEAMVRGTPVLAARATALPETGGAAAAYFDPVVPGDLVAALSGLLADGAERERAALAQRGLEHADAFSWEQTARATADVYRELL